MSDVSVNANLKIREAECLMTGHYTPNQKWTNEVWGLCTAKNKIQGKNIVLTCSDDATLRIWDADKKTQLSYYLFYYGKTNVNINDMENEYKARCIAIRATNDLILVGFYDGSLGAYSLSQDFKVTEIKKWKLAKEWISDIKFSPSDDFFAAGSHDNAIYIYKIIENPSTNFVKYRVLNKHSSYITHIDFSHDSSKLHSNCGAYELLFWDVNTGRQLPKGATELRDEFWDTWTATLGWPVQGIWPKESKGSDIDTVDRSALKHPEGYHLLAKGDDFSMVSIHKYPCIPKNSSCVQERGHSSHVTCVRWGP